MTGKVAALLSVTDIFDPALAAALQPAVTAAYTALMTGGVRTSLEVLP